MLSIDLNIWQFLEPIHLALVRPKTRKNLWNFYSQFIKSGSLCFDVGANIGNHTEVLVKLGARVIAVEPQSNCIKYLKKRFKNNSQVTIIEKGLADKEGELKLYICEEAPTISTFSERWKANPLWKGYRWNKEKIISVTTLDNLIEIFGLPDYCEIDVEGYENKVLKGLTKHIPIIYFEPNDDTEKNIKYLRSLGYKNFQKVKGNILVT